MSTFSKINLETVGAIIESKELDFSKIEANMVQVIQAQNVTLAYLKKKFALHKSEDKHFFTEWLDYLPAISELEQQYLDRAKRT